MNQDRDPDNLRTILGSVVQHNAGRWHRFILAILKNEADAEDVFQDAVRRVLVRDLAFRSEEEVRMYLGRAIGNAAMEFYNSRKRERRRQIPINEEILRPVMHPDRSTPSEELEQNREKEKLLGLLDEGLERLPSKLHEAVRLTMLDSHGLSIRDIGASCGIPYSTLRHRAQQGLRTLRRFLKRRILIDGGCD